MQEELSGAREPTLSEEAGMSMTATGESLPPVEPGAQGSLDFTVFECILYVLPLLLTVLFIKFSSAFRCSPVPTSLGRPSQGLFNL